MYSTCRTIGRWSTPTPPARDTKGRKVKGSEPENKSAVARVAKASGVHRDTARKSAAVQELKAKENAEKEAAKAQTRAKIIDMLTAGASVRGNQEAALVQVKAGGQYLSGTIETEIKRRALAAERGRPRNGENIGNANIPSASKDGTTRAYILARLERDTRAKSPVSPRTVPLKSK